LGSSSAAVGLVVTFVFSALMPMAAHTQYKIDRVDKLTVSGTMSQAMKFAARDLEAGRNGWGRQEEQEQSLTPPPAYIGGGLPAYLPTTRIRTERREGQGDKET